MPVNPKYERGSDNWEKRGRYNNYLDKADSIYLANYILGYFGSEMDAARLMRLQKIEHLRLKDLWKGYKNPFKDGVEIKDGNIGVNVYFTGTPNDSRKRQPPYIHLCDLTTSHVAAGGWQCTDFVVTLANDHQTIKFITDKELPFDEYILGFIRLDSGLLNNKPLQEYLGQRKLEADFVNAHIVTAKTIIPTQPFGRLLRGGKLISLLALSNELREFFNEKYGRNVVVWYTTSLYGSSKSSSQYDQLDRYMKFIGNTEGKIPLRMKQPHLENIINWLDKKGISRYNFKFSGSAKADKSYQELRTFCDHCLFKNQSDPHVKQLKKLFYEKIINEKITEKKRCYVTSYGTEDWADNLINPERFIDEKYNLENLFEYWKTKVFKKKDWGMRKLLKELPFKLNYETLDKQLLDPSFNQVR